MKSTLRSKVGYLVEEYLEDGVLAPGCYPESIKNLHTKVVQETISTYAPN